MDIEVLADALTPAISVDEMLGLLADAGIPYLVFEEILFFATLDAANQAIKLLNARESTGSVLDISA